MKMQRFEFADFSDPGLPHRIRQETACIIGQYLSRSQVEEQFSLWKRDERTWQRRGSIGDCGFMRDADHSSQDSLIHIDVTAISERATSLPRMCWAGSSAWHARCGAKERPVRKTIVRGTGRSRVRIPPGPPLPNHARLGSDQRRKSSSRSCEWREWDCQQSRI